MGRFMRIVGLVALMAALVLGSSGCTSSLVARAAQATRTLLARTDETADTNTLRREVQLLNLLNGLELSELQMQVILEKVLEAEEIRDRLRAEGDENQADVLRVLSQFKAVLMQGENVSDDWKREWHALYSESCALMEEYEREMDRLAREIEAHLEDYQRYALERFVPCIVPPEGELRIGQAGSTAGIEAILARVRQIPPQRFRVRKERLLEDFLQRLRVHLPRGYVLDEAQVKDKLLSVVEQARALSEVEFEVQKGDLAQQLKALVRVPAPPLSAKIKAHLLDPHIIPLLEEKLGNKHMNGARPYGPSCRPGVWSSCGAVLVVCATCTPRSMLADEASGKPLDVEWPTAERFASGTHPRLALSGAEHSKAPLG